MKLAVYGTLRNGSENTGKVKKTSLVYPGHQRFPAMIQDENGNGTVVEVHEVNNQQLREYDMYEGINTGLYKRVKVKVDMDSGEKVESWVYVAGPELIRATNIFKEIPNGDWHDR